MKKERIYQTIFAAFIIIVLVFLATSCEKPENEIEKPGIEAPPAVPGPALPIGG